MREGYSVIDGISKRLAGKTCRNKGDIVLDSSLDTTWHTPNCFVDPIKAMRGAKYVETVGETSENNWFINLIGIILFRHPGIDGRIIFTMGLEKFGCELVSCIEIAHTIFSICILV
jgi:hypothetical protein